MTAQISRVNMEGHLGNFICKKTVVLRLDICAGGGGFEIDTCMNNVIPNVYWYSTCWKKNSNKLVSIVRCTALPTDLHDTIWMQVNDKKEYHCCVEYRHRMILPEGPQGLGCQFHGQCSNCNASGVQWRTSVTTIRPFYSCSLEKMKTQSWPLVFED